MAAPAKRPSRKLLLAFLSVLLVASGLVFALPDTTPAAEAHDITYTETFPCETVQTPWGPFEHCPPPKVHVVSHTHCWNGKVIAFGIGSCPPRPTPQPTPKPCSLLSHRHGTTGPCHYTLRKCNGAWIDHDADCKVVQDCKPGAGQHRHASTNTCHGGNHSCPAGQVPTSTSTHGHVSGCKNPPPKDCTTGNGEHRHADTNTCHGGSHFCTTPGEHARSTTAHGHVVNCHSPLNPPHQCPAGQVVGSRDAHGHVSGCKPADCKPGNGEHRHASTNTCHADHPAEPVCGTGNAGQTVTWTTHTGADGHTQQSKVCPQLCSYDPNSEHRHASTNTCHADHAAEPVCGTGNAGQTVTWTTHTGTSSHTHHSKDCPQLCAFDHKTEHRHASTNTCHADHATCDSGKYKDETGTVYGSTGGDSHGYISVPGCNDRPTTTPGLICPTGQYVTTQNPIWIVQTADGPRHVTQEQVRQYPTIAINGELADWEQVSSNCYKPVLPEATQIKIDLGGIISTVTDPIATTWNVAKDEVVAAWTYVDNFLYVTLCQPFVGAGLGVTAGQVAKDIKAVASKSGPISFGVGVSIEGACVFEDWQRGRSSDQSSAQSSDQSSAGAVRPVGLVLAAGDGEIAVSWTASATAPADGFGYRVQWKLTTQTWDQAVSQYKDLHFGSNLSKWWIIGLANGSAYDVRVAAYNANGLSGWTTAQATPAKPAPAAASGLSLSPSDKQIAVSWSASATTPADGFGYRVQWKLVTQAWGDAAVGSEDLDHGSDLATSHTITGLVNGSAYDVRVAAFNADGLSAWISDQATPTAPAYKAPASLVATVRGYAAETHHGQDHVDRWNSALEGLCVEDFPGISAMTSAQAQGHANTYSSSRWSPVAAELKKAEAANCTIAPKPKPKAAAPDPASGLSVAAGDKQIAVSWSASATAPAAGFGYRVQWKLAAQAWGDAAAKSTDLDHGSDLATSHTITGLSNGSAYDVRVAAFNADGLSTWITGQTTPAAPKPKPKPSLAFESVSCASSGSGWVITATWSKTPETLKPDIWANEAKNYGHRGFQKAVAGTSTTFDVPNAGWYQVGMQAKIAGNKKVGDNKAVRCR